MSKLPNKKSREGLTETQTAIAEELDKIVPLDSLSKSEGGKILIKSLLLDVVSNVDTLCARYSALTMQEFVSYCADIKIRLDVARAIARSAEKKKELDEEFKKTLIE